MRADATARTGHTTTRRMDRRRSRPTHRIGSYMIKPQRILGVLGIVAALAATPALAQDFDGSVGYGGGGIWFSDFNAGSPGIPLALEAGWVAAGHIEHWIDRGRFGGRVNGAFSRRPLDTAGESRGIHTWIVGGDLLLRLFSASPGRSVAPFIGAGAGMVSYGLGSGGAVILSPEQARYPGDTDRQFSVSGAFGIDVLPSFTILGTPSGIRIEVIDHVALKSPFTPIDSGAAFDPVHNVRVSIGLLGLVQLLQ
jgi:hypothetical protein